MFNYLVYCIIVCLQCIFDHTINSCKCKVGKLLIIVHHIFQLYAFFGSLLFGWHELHVVLIVCALLVHMKYGSCPLTVVHNEYCGFDKNEPLYTILNKLAPSQNQNNKAGLVRTYYLWLSLVIVFDLMQITSKYMI